MGVTVLYLNPIFRARSNHRYDTGDYMEIDPLVGTQEEFEALCKKAEERGIRVMLDGVFSHTGEDSRYFNHFGTYDTVGAYQSKESPWYDWYTFKHFPDEYKCWWDITSLPEVRKDNADYQQFMFKPKEGVVPHWIHEGASGWRLDVADELSMDFLRKLRVAAKRARRDAVVLGEVWEDASNKVAYGAMRNYCTGDTLDSVMNYPLREAILSFATGKSDAAALVRLVRHQAEVYPAQFRYALMNLVGSHDRARALNILAEKEGAGLTKAEQHALTLTADEYALAVERYKLCVELLCALPGNPTIYYGDEAGLTGCHDPFCRRPFPWGHEDKALQAFVAAKLNERKSSLLLKYGYCDIFADDADTLRILRYTAGTDALGRKAPTKKQRLRLNGSEDAREEASLKRSPLLALPLEETTVGGFWGRGRFSKRSTSPPDPLSRRVAGNRLVCSFGLARPCECGWSPISLVESTAADRAAADVRGMGVSSTIR